MKKKKHASDFRAKPKLGSPRPNPFALNFLDIPNVGTATPPPTTPPTP